ncbi:MAG: hypothetical protein ACM3KR_00965 [Deltaproteobacteria bacterium]
MKRLFILISTLMLCILFVGCTDKNNKTAYNPPQNNSTSQNENQQKDGNSQDDNQQKGGISQQNNSSERNQPSQPIATNSLPEYKAPGLNSQEAAGTLDVTFNGTDKTYSSNYPIDNKGLNGSWAIILGNRDTIYISLPSDVKAGEEFTQEDARTSLASFSPPSFCFMYTDKSGTTYSVGDGANYYDSFGLIVDKFEGRGGYIEGRFAAEIRPLAADSIIMKNGRFKLKIKD